MTTWMYNRETDSAILQEGSDEIIMYTNDILPEIIEEVVRMHNEEYSLKKIKNYLQQQVDDETVGFTTDELDLVMESLEYWEGKEPEAIKSSNTVIHPMDEGKELTGHETVIQANQVPVQAEQPLVLAEKKPRKTREPKVAGTTVKKGKVSVETLEQSIEDQIKALQEKKALIAVLKNVPAIEIPENLTTSGRKIMVQLAVEYKQLMDKFAEQINEM